MSVRTVKTRLERVSHPVDQQYVEMSWRILIWAEWSCFMQNCPKTRRIQEGRFLKSALNLDLTLSDDGECLALLISCGIIDLGAFCVELWSFYVSKRISVPM